MSDLYGERRSRLMEMIGPEGLAVIPASRETVRNDDVHHEFRQASAFWYLTGFEEPEAVALLAPGHEEAEYVLVVRPKDPEKEVWTGIRAGIDGAREVHGADAAHELSELDEVIDRYMFGRDTVWYAFGDEGHDDRVLRLIRAARSHRERYGGSVPAAVRDVSVPIGELMLHKTAAEADLLRDACRLSADGHAEAMRFARPGVYEYQVQAVLEFPWRMAGSPRNGYPSIVASGANACILHYVENDSEIGESDLVLIDAACELDGYSSDITRTFPASGRFTPAQLAVYEVVLAAQRAALERCHPDSSLRAVHEEAKRVLAEGMVELGILPGPVDRALAMHHYSKFFMHGTSHWLGMDVHDRGGYRRDGKSRALEAGMAFTVEPGLYVGPDKAEVELALLEYDLDAREERRVRLGKKAAAAKDAEELEEAEKAAHEVPAEFVGIGVRIEDDVLIVEGGHENMTAHLAKDPGDVEDLVAEASSWDAAEEALQRAAGMA